MIQFFNHLKKNQSGKITVLALIIIAVVVIVLVSVAIISVQMLDSNGSQTVIIPEAIKPQLAIEINTLEEKQSSVILTVTATTEDAQGIESITLPDGNILNTTKTEYTVTKNGDYEFKVLGKNGQETIEKMTVTNIQELSQIQPYLPVGFSHVEGDATDGYVIQDQSGNQFVWVPVLNNELTRNHLNATDFKENDILTSEFVNSVTKNNGFYIGRYESGVVWNKEQVLEQYENPETKKVEERLVEKDVGTVTIKQGQVPWTNINYTDAYQVSKNMKDVYGYQNVTTALINSFAWDTTMKWIDKTNRNFSTATQNGNYSDTLAYTGTTPKDVANRIFDLSGNVREWSTEIFIPTTAEMENKDASQLQEGDYRVVRGGSVTLNKTASSFNGYPIDTTAVYWGFRVILYQ